MKKIDDCQIFPGVFQGKKENIQKREIMSLGTVRK